MNDSAALAERIAAIAADKKASDIRVIDLRGIVSYTDFFVPVEIPRGRSTFTVRVDPPATLGPPGDNRFLSVYISNWLFEPLTGPLARVRPLTPRLTNPNPIPPGAS